MTKTLGLNADEATFLEKYEPTQYAPVAVTADVALFTILQGQMSVLLVERGSHPFKGSWALPGGFVNPEETLEEAARRELAEETGRKTLPADVHLEQLATYGNPGRDPRMRVVTVAHLAMAPDLPMPEGGSDAVRARFWAVRDLFGEDAPQLAFDHQNILVDALERLRSKIEYTPEAIAFVHEPFTLAELRRVYEAVWDAELDPSNFARKILQTENLILPLEDNVATGGRPARLYRRGTAQLLHPAMLRPGLQ